ncbi:MAG: aldehyde:ferredoxin oxidoreductase [Planctomycetota bacterium]|nr:aldehyde:ferredoxin oxidoreductase [Planctomycetota bacterium]
MDAAATPQVTDFSFTRVHVNLADRSARTETVQCADLEDFLGGIGRAFKVLEPLGVDDAYAPEATLVMNLGRLSGTEFMTGLRTFFTGYSPLKASLAGKPAAMWTAGSGKFGTKLKAAGVDEICFTGRAAAPTLLRITPGPEVEFLDAADLAGKSINGKIQALHDRYADAHFAVIGPAGEHYESVRVAAIGLSTVNQLKSGDPKARYCGRGGFGGVMGSKNLLAIAADAPDVKGGKPKLKEINIEVARGRGSQRFRDADKGNGGGGTWANYEHMNPIHIVPENNFVPTGTEASYPLHRAAVEAGPYTVKDEACYRCGIKCHKNVYDESDGKFRAKLDYEPLNLLSSNLGIFDVDPACDLVEQVDELGMDSISLGVTLSYAMEYNKRHPDAPIADGLSYGDAAAAGRVIEKIGRGELPQLGQGVKRLSEEMGETGYAMHCKGVEFPAYLPQTNPGYPWALAGGHMSMNTYLLLMYEKETGLDYWIDAITNRGPRVMRDDLLGLCKFSGMGGKHVSAAIKLLYDGLELSGREIGGAVTRTYLRGYRMERAQGFTDADYDMPSEIHKEYPQLKVPHFNTKEFFGELKGKVLAKFDEMVAEAGI